MKKLILRTIVLISISISPIMVLSAEIPEYDDQKKVECKEATLVRLNLENNKRETVSVQYCSMTLYQYLGYGQSQLDMTFILANKGKELVIKTCEEKKMVYASYIDGFAYGGMENFKVETDERLSHSDGWSSTKITGSFYCVPPGNKDESSVQKHQWLYKIEEQRMKTTKNK